MPRDHRFEHRILALLAASSALFGTPRPATAVQIGLDPESQNVTLGSGTQVAVFFSDLGDEVVSAYDLDIAYDSAVLEATGVVFTTALGDELFFEVFNDFDVFSAGIVDLAQLSLLSDPELAAQQTGARVTVATLLFDAVAAGSTTLGFVFDDFNDVKGRAGLVLPLAASGASVTVQAAVPEPSGALLFTLGLALLRLRRRADRRFR